MSKEKIVFLDRDGTIIKDYLDREWTNITEAEFLDEVTEGLKIFANNGYSFIIITNQYIIGEGHISFADYIKINKQVEQLFRDNKLDLKITLFCPHKIDHNCLCHKPNNQLFHIANSLYNIDLNNSLMIGDSDADMLFAKNSNLKFYRTSENVTIKHIANEYFK